jgi:hypothetical protein
MSGIVRVKRTPGDFFQAYKPTFQNEKLSFAARGLLAYLCTKPDDWEARNYDLEKASPGGKAALQTILKELRDAGYIRRVARRKDDGTFIGWDTEVYENPADNPDYTTDTPVSRLSDKPNVGETDSRETGERKELIMNPTNNNSLYKSKSPKNTKQQKPTPADIEYYNPLSQSVIDICDLAIPLVNGTKLDFTGVVKFLNANKATPEQVKEFAAWYDGTPSMRVITDQWGLFIRGKQPRKYRQSNGSGHHKNGASLQSTGKKRNHIKVPEHLKPPF